MTQFIKAMRSIFCSLLFIAMACSSFAVFGSSLKRIELNKQQADDSDSLREVLRKAHSATNGIKSFRIRMEAPTVSKVAATILDYASPDRARLSWGNQEVVWIGKDIYRKKADGPWEKFITQDKDEFKSDFPDAVLKRCIEMIEKADEVKFIGRETVDGIPALAYQHTRYMRPNKTNPFTSKTWFNEADGSLLKNQIFCIVLGSTPSPVDYTFYDYNADIRIEPPAEYVSVTAPEGISLITAPYRKSGISSEPFLGDPKGIVGGLGQGSNFPTGGARPNPNVPTTSVDQRPVALNFPRPNYTEKARNNRVQGIVRVKLLVGADGVVKQVRVTSGLPDGLNEEAIRCAYRVRFKPAMKDGQPVTYWVGMDVEFHLRWKVN
jgi:TonB family protein